MAINKEIIATTSAIIPCITSIFFPSLHSFDLEAAIKENIAKTTSAIFDIIVLIKAPIVSF